MTKKQKTVLDEIKIGYADFLFEGEKGKNERILHFKATEELTPKQAYEVLKKVVQGYNSFDAENILGIPENCKVRLAREGSVCLYVKSKEALSESKLRKLTNGEEVDLWESPKKNKKYYVYRLAWD